MWGKILTIRPVKLPSLRDRNLKKRVTWSQDSLYVQENIVIKDNFEESPLKMISPFEYEISAVLCSAHILQQAQQTEIPSTMMEMRTFSNKNLSLVI